MPTLIESLLHSKFALCWIALVLCSCMPIVFLRVATQGDFVVNGSFEDGNFAPDNVSGNFMNIVAPSNYIPGWYVAAGNIDWVRGRWKASFDGSPSCVDLNGIQAGTITTAVAAGLPENNITYRVIFDAGANPDGGPGLIASFTLTALDNVSLRVLNSSLFYTNSSEFITNGWKTFGNFLFTVFGNFGVNLTFQSLLIDGPYGPILDNVRVFQVSLSTYSSPPTSTAMTGKSLHPLVSGIVAGIAVAAAFLLSCCLAIVTFWRWKKPAGGSADPQHHLSNIGRLKSYNRKEVTKMTNGFRNEIGRGGQGVVYLAVLPDGGKAAVKRVKKLSLSPNPHEFNNDSDAHRSLWMEFDLLARLHHRNLVSLLGFCVDGDEILLLYEFMENGALSQQLHSGLEVLTWSKRLRIALGVAQGLEYLHSFAHPPLVHRDIKSSNVLLDENMQAKVADFGLSKEGSAQGSRLASMSTVAKGTIGYIDPMYVRTQRLTEKSDVYSYGVLLLEILTAREVIDREWINIVDWFKSSEVMEDARKLWDERLNRREGFSLAQLRALAKIAGRCVADKPENRASMGEVVRCLHEAVNMQPQHGLAS